jgi:hypothetical protein
MVTAPIAGPRRDRVLDGGQLGPQARLDGGQLARPLGVHRALVHLAQGVLPREMDLVAEGSRNIALDAGLDVLNAFRDFALHASLQFDVHEVSIELDTGTRVAHPALFPLPLLCRRNADTRFAPPAPAPPAFLQAHDRHRDGEADGGDGEAQRDPDADLQR